MCPSRRLFSLHSFLSHAPNMAFLPSPELSHLVPGLQGSGGPRRAGRAPPDPGQASPAPRFGSWLCHLLRYLIFWLPSVTMTKITAGSNLVWEKGLHSPPWREGKAAGTKASLAGRLSDPGEPEVEPSYTPQVRLPACSSFSKPPAPKHFLKSPSSAPSWNQVFKQESPRDVSNHTFCL